MDYYIIRFEDEKIARYAIWYTDDEDGFVCENGHIRFFTSEEALKAYADAKSISLHDEVYFFDIGRMKQLLSAEFANFDCTEILNFWNMISDALRSMGKKFSGDGGNERIDCIYDKLFYGADIPAHHTGKRFVWTKEELDLIKKVLSQYTCFWDGIL